MGTSMGAQYDMTRHMCLFDSTLDYAYTKACLVTLVWPQFS